MKTLIVSATLLEAKQIIKNLNFNMEKKYLYKNSFYNADLLITGIGDVSCVFSLLTLVDVLKYDFVLNIGISGAYSESVQFGSLYNVSSDCFADTVIEKEGRNAESVFELKYNSNFTSIISNGIIVNNSKIPKHFEKITKVSGNTVNKSNHNLIGNRADVESMEGAAFMMVCKYFNKPFVQLRAISNIVGITPRDQWDFDKPINSFTAFVDDFVNDTYWRQFENII